MKRIALALLVCQATVACSSGTKRVGSQPSWRGGKAPVAATSAAVVKTTFAPTSEPATRYNEPLQPPPSSPLGDAVIAAVREAAAKAGVPAPAADARLFRACAELAEVVPEDGIAGYGVVAFALQRQGIIEPTRSLLVLWGGDDPDTIVEKLRPQLPDIVAAGATGRLGIGLARRKADGTNAIVFVLQTSGVATNPIPRSLPANGSFSLDAVVDAHYREPELFVTHEDGTTEQIALEIGRAGGFKAKVACGKHAGRQQIEIMASDAQGSAVLANFPVWCAQEPPLSFSLNAPTEAAAPVTADDAEKRLFALANRDREAAGLPALQWDDRVAAVARAHSEDMRQTKIVAHISPTTGSAADRVRAAGIKTGAVFENVARAYAVGEAHGGLMDSPSHRANVLSSKATHIGIGVVLGAEVSSQREMFVTEVFIRVPPKVEPARVATIVRDRINAVRPIQVNPRLTSVAQELADGLAGGKSRDSLWSGVKKKLDGMNTSYARVGSVTSAVADLDMIDGKQLVGDYKPDDIGVGIAQGFHPEIGDGAVWIVVLMAEKLPKR
ncbi:MAG: hypothetical protein HOV81_27900 [Kofleriaceae bacterium]|nr:hypothetical protein [Kofleriaceae bacterium]